MMTKNKIIETQAILINKLKTVLSLYEDGASKNMLASLVKLLKEAAVCSVCGIAITQHIVKKGAIGYEFKYSRPDANVLCFFANADVTQY